MPPVNSCEGIGDPHYFYVTCIYTLNSLMMAIVFVYGWYLSGNSLWGGWYNWNIFSSLCSSTYMFVSCSICFFPFSAVHLVSCCCLCHPKHADRNPEVVTMQLRCIFYCEKGCYYKTVFLNKTDNFFKWKFF